MWLIWRTDVQGEDRERAGRQNAVCHCALRVPWLHLRLHIGCGWLRPCHISSYSSYALKSCGQFVIYFRFETHIVLSQVGSGMSCAHAVAGFQPVLSSAIGNSKKQPIEFHILFDPVSIWRFPKWFGGTPKSSSSILDWDDHPFSMFFFFRDLPWNKLNQPSISDSSTSIWQNQLAASYEATRDEDFTTDLASAVPWSWGWWFPVTVSGGGKTVEAAECGDPHTMWGPRWIAKLANITPITMIYGTQITI